MIYVMPTSFAQLVRKLLLAKEITQEEMAERLGVTQSTVSRWLAGAEPTHKKLIALQELAVKEGLQNKVESDLAALFQTVQTQSVPLRGHVGAAAMVYMAETGPGHPEIEYIQVPIGFGNVEAVQVRGDSMLPAFRDGDILLYGDDSQRPVDLIGHGECIVRLADDRWFVKVIERGTRAGLFDLISHNSSPIRNVRIIQATPVRYVIKAH